MKGRRLGVSVKLLLHVSIFYDMYVRVRHQRRQHEVARQEARVEMADKSTHPLDLPRRQWGGRGLLLFVTRVDDLCPRLRDKVYINT